jgi:hypothetical protein
LDRARRVVAGGDDDRQKERELSGDAGGTNEILEHPHHL